MIYWIKQTYIRKPPLKPKRTGFGGSPGWWTSGDSRRAAHLERAWKLRIIPVYCPMQLFHLAVLELLPVINGCPVTNISLKSVSRSSKLSPRRGSWKLLVHSHLFRSTGDNLDLWLGSEGGGQSGRTETVICGIWCCVRVNGVRTESNCRAPSLC